MNVAVFYPFSTLVSLPDPACQYRLQACTSSLLLIHLPDSCALGGLGRLSYCLGFSHASHWSTVRPGFFFWAPLRFARRFGRVVVPGVSIVGCLSPTSYFRLPLGVLAVNIRTDPDLFFLLHVFGILYTMLFYFSRTFSNNMLQSSSVLTVFCFAPYPLRFRGIDEGILLSTS